MNDTAFDVYPDAVDRAQEMVASLADEYLQWLSADIDEIEKSLPKADKNPQRVDQLRRKAHDKAGGQGSSLGFPLTPHLTRGLHLVMISQDGPRSGKRADLPRWIVVERRASNVEDFAGSRHRTPMTQSLKVEIRYDGPTMLNIIKLAVGIEDIDHLFAVQERKLAVEKVLNAEGSACGMDPAPRPAND